MRDLKIESEEEVFSRSQKNDIALGSREIVIEETHVLRELLSEEVVAKSNKSSNDIIEAVASCSLAEEQSTYSINPSGDYQERSSKLGQTYNYTNNPAVSIGNKSNEQFKTNSASSPVSSEMPSITSLLKGRKLKKNSEKKSVGKKHQVGQGTLEKIKKQMGYSKPRTKQIKTPSLPDNALLANMDKSSITISIPTRKNGNYKLCYILKY